MPRFTPKTKTFTMPDVTDRFPTTGNPPDGYVITFSALDGYYYPKPTSKLQTFTSPTTSPYNVGAEDVVLVQTHVGTFTVNLPASPAAGTMVFIKDAAGVALTNNISVVSAALIDGATPYTINTGYGCVKVIFDGTTWSVLSKF